MALQYSEIDKALELYKQKKSITEGAKSLFISFLKKSWLKILLLTIINIIILYGIHKIKNRLQST
jgi:hypothetical protein